MSNASKQSLLTCDFTSYPAKLLSISDNMAMDSDGDLMMRMGNNMAMDMDTGDIHMISSWPNDDDEDGLHAENTG